MKHTLVLAALFLAASCVSPEAHRRLLGENDQLRAQHADMIASQKSLVVENERLAAQVADLTGRAADASWIAEQKKKINELLEKYGAAGNQKIEGVEVIRSHEGIIFRVAGGVLFAPGRNDLSEQGKRTLTELMGSLQDKKLRVEGHTDDTKITKSQWGTNLRLSVERAMVVAEYLTKTVGLKAENIGVSGYGEYKPADPGTDDTARAHNRRVEILMLND